ncbi:MAG: hypothetical protein ACR2KQ_02845 [Actinomycetota bacterium]
MDHERIAPGDQQDWRRLLGRKVSIRYRLHDDGAGDVFSEAIGVVMGVSEASAGSIIKIVTKRGEVREVPVGDVVAGKAWLV